MYFFEFFGGNFGFGCIFIENIVHRIFICESREIEHFSKFVVWTIVFVVEAKKHTIFPFCSMDFEFSDQIYTIKIAPVVQIFFEPP